jgi:hypothetical protein
MVGCSTLQQAGAVGDLLEAILGAGGACSKAVTP